MTIYIDGANKAIVKIPLAAQDWTAKEVKEYAINPWQVYLDE